jgi:hypothetical protein
MEFCPVVVDAPNWTVVIGYARNKEEARTVAERYFAGLETTYQPSERRFAGLPATHRPPPGTTFRVFPLKQSQFRLTRRCNDLIDIACARAGSQAWSITVVLPAKTTPPDDPAVPAEESLKRPAE